MDFFKVAWNIIKHDFMKVVAEFQEEDRLNWRTNCSFISLLPKLEQVGSPKDFRPISLVSSIYKILAKVLTVRLKSVMPKLISDVQGAFIADRQILDGILIAGELVDSRIKSGKHGVLVKLDIQKAFDNISWQTIRHVLVGAGFGNRWVSWIMWCVETAQHSILINGRSTNRFTPQKGLRQGDPLSAFIFILVAEILTKLLQNAAQLNMISGFSVQNGESITHLQYADDTLVFIDATDEEAENLLLVLHIFEAITGLPVNFTKSAVVSIGVERQISSIAAILNCKIERLPLKYLGLPIGVDPRSITIWDCIVEKFQKKLTPWKRRFFSKAGGMTLIKSSLSSLPIYFMSIYSMPSTVEKKLNKIMRDFLWGSTELKKRIVWVAWRKVCRPKLQGGLGIRNLKLTNIALTAKWTWRYSKEGKRLWRKIIQTKMCGKENDIWVKDNTLAQGVGIWKGIQKKKAVIECNTNLTINNGRGIKFWWDLWRQGPRLKDKYPAIYKIAAAQDASLSDLIFNNHWRLALKRAVLPSEMSEIIELYNFIGVPPILTAANDQLSCSLQGGWSAKECYGWLSSRSNLALPTVNAASIWVKHVPPKVQFFMWAASQNAIATRDNLIKRGCPILNLTCGLCNSENEAVNHLLLHYEISAGIWSYFLQGFSTSWVHSDTLAGELLAWRGRFCKGKSRNIWPVTIFAICWSIWEERNRRVMATKRPRGNSLLNKRKPIYNYGDVSSFSEYTVVHSGCAVKISPTVSLEKICLLSCGVVAGLGAAWKVADISKGSNVAIFGLGTVGLSVAQGARLRGASRIIEVDTNPDKYEKDFINPADCDEPVQQEIQVDEFITHDLAFEDINNTFDLMREGKCLRCVIHMPNK